MRPDRHNYLRVVFLAAAIMVSGFPAEAADNQVSLTANLKKHISNLEHLHGSRVTPRHMSGDFTLVTFFASWCGPCNQEMNHLEKYHKQFEKLGTTIIAINVWEDFGGFSDTGQLKDWIADRNPSFPVVKENRQTRGYFLGVPKIPSVFIFDKNGKQIYRFDRRTSEDSFAEAGELLKVIQSSSSSAPTIH